MNDAALSPIDLRCEALSEPLAVNRADPRLSWRFTVRHHGARQIAWQVQIARSTADCSAGRNLIHDSGRVDGASNHLVPWPGPGIEAGGQRAWRVRAWDEAGRVSAWSDPTRCARGLADWGAAQWIGYAVKERHEQPLLRRGFAHPRPVVEARLYLAARGIVRAWIDGQPVSDEWFAPGFHDYAKRLLYRCYDVTALLAQAGGHCLGLELGEGWFKGSVAWGPPKTWGDATSALALLRMTHDDGSISEVASDTTWRSIKGPVLAGGFLAGEHHDASLDPVGWTLPGFADAAWPPAVERPRPQVPIEPHSGPPVRVVGVLPAQRRWQVRPGAWILDLGRNIAGVVRLRLDVPAGTTLRLRHGEMVLPNQTLYVDNLRSADAIDTYTARGGGETWEPRSTFHGFQYVEITGWPGDGPQLADVEGLVLASDCPVTGDFACSDERLNRFYANVVTTQLANWIDVPTDCPQRDERLGWTGDAQAFVRTATCHRDVQAFFTKWHQDLRDAQTAEGAFSNVAPCPPPIADVWLARGDAGWGDAGVICPWTIWRCYGDREQLSAMWPAMLRWCAYLDKTALSDLHLRARLPGRDKLAVFGDWLSVDGYTPTEIIMTAFWARSVELTADSAAVLGHGEDEGRLRALHARIAASFRRAFVRADGRIRGFQDEAETQTSCLLALHFGLLEPSQVPLVFAHLVRLIGERGCHLTTGFLGQPYLLPVLSAQGRSDLAFALLTTETYPSWLYPVSQGATSIWERWNGWRDGIGPADPGMNSYSHYAYGAAAEWMFSDILGIDLLEPAFTAIRIRPRIGGGLTWARGHHLSPQGRIGVAWTLRDGVFTLDLDVPANTRALVEVPCADPASLCCDGKAIASRPGAEAGYAALDLTAGSWRLSSRV